MIEILQQYLRNTVEVLLAELKICFVFVNDAVLFISTCAQCTSVGKISNQDGGQ